MNHYRNFLLASLLWTLVMNGQSKASLSRYPLWPPSGEPNLDRFPPNTYLFLDPKTENYIAYYPESLSQGTASSKGFRRLTIELQNKAKVTAFTTLAKSPTGEIVYDYTLSNAPDSSHPLVRWVLKAETSDDSLTMEHPSWRKFGASSPTLTTRTGSSDSSPVDYSRSINPTRLIMWSTTESESPVRPGASGLSFQTKSRFRRGLTTAYFVGGPNRALAFSVPEPVMQQIQQLMNRDTMWRSATVIGPRFSPDKSALWRASDWHLGLQRLVFDGKLDSKSKFVLESQKALDAIVREETESVAIGETRAKYVWAISARPANTFEAQLFEALKLCFE